MFRRLLHRLGHATRPARGAAFDPDHTDLAQAIHALDRRLTELRRELEAEARDRLREVRGPGIAGY